MDAVTRADRGGVADAIRRVVFAWWVRPGRRSIVLAWLGAMALASGLWWATGFESPRRAWHDLKANLFAPVTPVSGVLLVDIDEPSVRALRARHGGWPPSRDLLARVTTFAFESGARAVVIDIVLADPREGDGALAEVIAAHPGRVVLAASVLPSRQVGPGPAWVSLGGCPAHGWPGLLLPAASLEDGSVGMVSTPTDDDGQLRAWALWHGTADRGLPSLPFAALAAARGIDAATMRCVEGVAEWGGLRWPIDAQGRVRPAWHRDAAAVPLRSYAALAKAALGADDPLLRADLRDSVVVIGASAVLGDRAQTPLGPRWGPAVVAETMAALESGALIAPPSARFDAFGWLIACLPLLWALRRGRLRQAADLPAVAVALLALAALDIVAYAGAGQQSRLLFPMATLACFALLLLLQWRTAMLTSQLQLERERVAADAASRVKSEFLAHMSHEIRTPMNALLGSAELLAKTRLDDRQSRHVALFQSAGASLLEILNDLLDLSKIEAGLLELHKQPFSLVDLVASQTVLFEARAAQKGLRLHTAFDPDLPPVVVGDGPRLAQVLRNLLGNAIKFTHHGEVALAVRRVADAPQRLCFEVRDTGIGIPAARQKEIFEAFTQADSGVTRAYGGTGLGLTISLRLVVLMGGSIEVDSREGVGSTFHLTIDLPASSEAPVALWLPSLPDPDSDLAPGLSILLADDNPQNVQLVQAYLENDGHLLDVVHDGTAAIERFRAGRYDVVLMDVEMPGMDGYRATAAMRAIERERGDAPIPVIALTANAMPDDERRSLQAGCTVHLTKPFSRGQLRRALAGAPRAAEAARPEVDAFAGAPAPLPVLAALPGFDVASALARMEGDIGLYLRVLNAAGSAFRTWEARFDAAADDGQRLRLAHDLKSNAATLGAEALSSAARELEAILKKPGHPFEDVVQARQAIKPPLDALLAALLPPAAQG
jgi:signal transduction histidine kinase/DNA-binding response OmpR family regulator